MTLSSGANSSAASREGIRIVLAEDDPLLRNLLVGILTGESGFQVVAHVGSGRLALDEVRTRQPHVLLLDLGLPELTGFEVLERLAVEEHAPNVLVLSADEAEDTQVEAARRGARGFLCKSQAMASLADAIRAIAAGGVWFNRQIVGRVFGEYPRLVKKVRDSERPMARLTDREREVLLRVARGLTNQQIAGELYMSVSTVKAHIRNIFQRFDLPNRTEAAVFAVREGLLDEPRG
jgi:DNA-binding NarL/FixJ family response regulator